MFNAKVICDSISQAGKRLVSIEIEYPRVILAEVNTHTVLSKNTSSSRAIPFYIDRLQRPRTSQECRPSMLEMVNEDPYYPTHWGRNEAGMQGYTELSEEEIKQCKLHYGRALNSAMEHALEMFKIGLHKQYCNRLIEPWSWTKQLITGTEWANFFALRTHHAAHPDMQRIAKMMFVAMRRSEPRVLGPKEWHLPYVVDASKYPLVDAITISVASCARLSYMTHDGLNPTLEKDQKLVERLSSAAPKHMSPFMHQARPAGQDDISLKLRSNLFGWIQNRKLVADENIEAFEPTEEEYAQWESLL